MGERKILAGCLLVCLIYFVSCMDLDALLESIETEADWPEEAKPFQLIEKSLKCSICHATMRSAVMLSNCGHSFCSYCIRQFLLKEKICPLCRKPATESDIVRNITLNEVLDIFKEQRNDLLELCRLVFSKSHTSAMGNSSSTTPSQNLSSQSVKRANSSTICNSVEETTSDSDFVV